MAAARQTIPTVDFSRWANGTPEEKQRIATELVDACRDVGFTYVTGHTVPTQLVKEAFEWSKRLFGLPHETKMLAKHPPGIFLSREELPDV